MRLKEKKPSPALTHEAFAIERHGKFVACYQSPCTGVRFVKKESGELEAFNDAVWAELSAARRLFRELDKRTPLKITKEVRLAPRRPKWKR